MVLKLSHCSLFFPCEVALRNLRIWGFCRYSQGSLPPHQAQGSDYNCRCHHSKWCFSENRADGRSIFRTAYNLQGNFNRRKKEKEALPLGFNLAPALFCRYGTQVPNLLEQKLEWCGRRNVFWLLIN